MQQIRHLVESYYDVQKLRLGVFNRIVAHARSHLSHETQGVSASHFAAEAQLGGASQGLHENHHLFASHMSHENHMRPASQVNAEAHPNNASHVAAETQQKAAVKPSTLAYDMVRLKRKVPSEIAELVWLHNSLYTLERDIAKRLGAWSKRHPIRVNFLSKIRGLGPILSSGIIAWLEPISRFQNISKLWSYCGLAPGQARRKGEKANYNPKLKSLCWKIGGSFVKQKPERSRYRRIYEEKKRYYMERADLKPKLEKGEKGVKGHIHNMALRYTVKRFLADLWLEWRKLEGLPVTKPYVIDVAGHSDFQHLEADRET